jgi:SAM-dependent methyltransferase
MTVFVRTRWAEEAAFFDEKVARERILPITPFTFARYSAWRRRRFPEEFKFRVIGDLRGKRVLDVGCGDGINSVLFAKMGAEVTGLDLSPRSIEAANERARVNQVKASFVCGALETTELSSSQFDVIWCDAFLHHVLDHLPLVLERLKEWAVPSATFIICEPVNLWPALRALRLALFPISGSTSGERPLERSELAIVREHLTGAQSRYFRGLARVDRILLPHGLEKASAARRLLYSSVLSLDFLLLSLPMLRNAAGQVVVYGTAR